MNNHKKHIQRMASIASLALTSLNEFIPAADFSFEYGPGDVEALTSALQGILPTYSLIRFSSRSPGGMGKNNTFVINDLPLPLALAVEAVLLGFHDDFVAVYGGYRFFKVNLNTDSWHYLTGEDEYPEIPQLSLLDAMSHIACNDGTDDESVESVDF